MLPGQDRGRARQPRLGIVDIYDLDRQRQLILLRRDNVEHLLLIGGPNDVVIKPASCASPEGDFPPCRPSRSVRSPASTALPSSRRGRKSSPMLAPPSSRQIAARLNDLVARPSERSDADQELTAIGTIAGTAPARVEPPLRPDAITMTNSPGPRSGRSEPAPQAAPRQAPVPPPESSPARTEARPTPPPLRPVTPPRPMTTPEPVRPAPQRPATAPQSQSASQDAAILTDMAKQLEEALKRPAGANPAEAQAPAPRNPLHQPRVHSAPDRSDVDGEAELPPRRPPRAVRLPPSACSRRGRPRSPRGPSPLARRRFDRSRSDRSPQARAPSSRTRASRPEARAWTGAGSRRTAQAGRRACPPGTCPPRARAPRARAPRAWP